jgi:glutaredoxin 2
MTRPLVSVIDSTYQMTLSEEEKHLATVVREMTDAEYAQHLLDVEDFEANLIEQTQVNE